MLRPQGIYTAVRRVAYKPSVSNQLAMARLRECPEVQALHLIT